MENIGYFGDLKRYSKLSLLSNCLVKKKIEEEMQNENSFKKRANGKKKVSFENDKRH